MRAAYIVLGYLLAPVYCGVLLWRGLRERGYWSHFSERFGFGRSSRVTSIWVHAVSMGEVQAASALIRSLRDRHPQFPLVISTITPAGRERALALFGGAPGAQAGTSVRYAPLDLPGSVRRFFDRVRPGVGVILETEVWPNLYHECGRRNVPLVLASARLSPRSVRRFARVPRLLRQTLSHRIVIAAQTQGDADRFVSIGANPQRTHVTGNVKFDIHVPSEVVARGRELRAQHARERPVWVAGSTHRGEEQIVLDAHRRVRMAHSNGLLVLVPRHPGRFAEVIDWLVRERVRFIKRSQGNTCEPDTEVLLVDTLGELLDFYAAGDVAFVGGSLVPIGGHNLLEPAALGLPVLSGPHNFNGTEITRLLIERGAVQIASDAVELGEKVGGLLANADDRARIGALARAAVEENRGALERVLGLIAPLLERSTP